jgi:hypothetical protein
MPAGSPNQRSVPLFVKIAYTLWMAVWAPVYWVHNGPANFLWICDFANFVTLPAIWRESRLLLSSQLVGIAAIQLIWSADYFGRLLLGRPTLGATEYMFDPASPLWLRGLSLFHLWMTPLLYWLCRRLGYDRRGVWLQTAFTALLLALSLLAASPDKNLNWMWAPFGIRQRWLPPALFAGVATLILACVVYLPTDWLLRRGLPRRWRLADRGAT